MIKAPQSLEVLYCSAALAAQTSMLYFLCCNLIFLLLVHLRQNVGGGRKSTTTLFMMIFYIFEDCSLHFLQIFLLWTLQSQFFQIFLWVMFSRVSLLLSFRLPPSLFKGGTQHSIPVKWNNCISCFALKASHLSILPWWLLFSHRYSTYLSLWCIINPLTCFSAELMPTYSFPILQQIVPKPMSSLNSILAIPPICHDPLKLHSSPQCG